MMECKTKSINQTEFMKIKHKLDKYRLPTTFSLDSLELISKLLHMLEQLSHSKLNHHPRYYSKATEKPTKTMDEDFRAENSNLNLKISNLISENNSLRQELRAVQHQNQVMKHMSRKQNRKVVELQHQFDELKYKYNELLDMVHGQEGEKQYIKRMRKWKKVEKVRTKAMDRDEFRIPLDYEKIKGQIDSLKGKLIYRDLEILRLKKICSEPPIKSQQVQRFILQANGKAHSSNIKSLNYQIDYLMEENQKLKKQSVEKRKIKSASNRSSLNIKFQVNQYGIQKQKQNHKEKKKQNLNSEQTSEECAIKKHCPQCNDTKISKLIKENEMKQRNIVRLQKIVSQLTSELRNNRNVQKSPKTCQPEESLQHITRKTTLKTGSKSQPFSKQSLLFENQINHNPEHIQNYSHIQQKLDKARNSLTNLTCKFEEGVIQNQRLEREKNELKNLNRVYSEKLKEMETALEIQSKQMQQFYQIYEAENQ